MFFPLRTSVFLGKSQIKLRFLPNLSLAESNVIHVNKNVGLCLYPNVCILDIRFRPWSRLLRQFHLFVNAGSEFKNIHYNEGHIQKHLWVEEINQFAMVFFIGLGDHSVTEAEFASFLAAVSIIHSVCFLYSVTLCLRF